MAKHTITIYISYDLLQKIDNKAKQQNRSRSNFIEAELKKTIQPQKIALT
jgi:metal-responsive CopG/Arc/MetJ family transcriptional regulator